MATATAIRNIGKVVQHRSGLASIRAEHLPEAQQRASDSPARRRTAPDIHVTVEGSSTSDATRCAPSHLSTTGRVVRGHGSRRLTRGPITVPVGGTSVGRILNVLVSRWQTAAPIPKDRQALPIHRSARTSDNLEPRREIFRGGHSRFVDLVAPFVKGGKIGLFGGAGVRKTSFHHGVDQTTVAKDRR